MKKIALLLTVLIIIVSLPALAAAKQVTFSDETGNPGDTVTVSIDVDNLSGITGYNIDFTYDPTVLSANSAAVGANFSGYTFIPNLTTAGVVKLGMIGVFENPSTDPGELATVTFTILNNAYKNSPLTFTQVTLSDQDGNEIPGTTSTDGSVTVAGVTVTVSLTPASVTDVVAGQAVTMTAEVLVNGSHLDLTSTDDVTFETPGNGTFGPKSVVNGNVQVDYTTNTLVETATITATENVTGNTYQDIATITSIPGDLATLTLSPDSLALTTDQTQQFTVSGADSNDNPVSNIGTITWSVSGGIGNIDNNGLFDATTVGQGSVTATSSFGPSVTSGTITVNVGAFVFLTVSPDTAALTSGATQQFSVAGTDADGNTISNLGTITWSVNGGIGDIDNNGLFTATTAGTGSIVATSDLGPSDTSGIVTVDAGPLAELTVSPDTQTITADETIQFSVTGKDANDNPVANLGNITWSVTGGIGTIDNTGLFTATTVGTGYVTATSDIDSVFDDSGDITVTPGVLAVLTVSPDTQTITADETIQFSVTGKDANDNPVANLGNITWSVTGGIGTIDNTGLFTATTVGTGYVTATSDIDSVFDDSGDITVTPGVLAVLTVSPDTQTITADETIQFSVTGKDANDNPVANIGNITWSVTGGIGTIDANGLLTATTVGTGYVTATSDIGSVFDDSGDITVTPGVLAVLTVSPDTQTITADDTLQFTLSGKDADNNTVSNLGNITWSVTGGIGTIDANGLLTATTVGTGYVTATSDIDSVFDDSGDITVTPGVLATLTVSPDTATLTADDTQQFSATGVDADGNAVTVLGTITWGVTGGIGTIDNAGLFDATTVGTGTVTATSDIGPADSSGTVTVTPGAATKMTLQASKTTLASDAKSTATLTATILDQNDNVVTGDNTTVVTFTLSDDTYLSLSSATDTAESGVAEVTVTTKPGTVTNPPATSDVSITSAPALTPPAALTLTIVNFSAAAEFDALVTSGTPHVTTITAVGATNYTWTKVSGNGTLVATTSATATFTAPDSITEGIAGHPTVIRVADAADSQVNFDLTITTYEPVRFTQPTAPVGITHDGDVNTYQLQVAGGDGNYTYQVSDSSSDVITVDANGLVTGKAIGTKTVNVIDGNGDFAAPDSFLSESFAIEVVDGIVVTPASMDLQASTTQQYAATGGKGEGTASNYTWSVDNAAAGSIDANGLFTAQAVDSIQPANVRATDKTYTNIYAEATVTVYPTVGISDKPDEAPTLLPTEDITLTAVGGSGNYEWSVTDPSGIAGSWVDGETFTFVAPDTGAFAGVYEIALRDKDNPDFTDTFQIKVPMLLDPDFYVMLENITSKQLSLKGAPAGTTFTVTQYDLANNDVTGTPGYGSVDNGDGNSPIETFTYTPDDVDEIESFTLLFVADTPDDSLENADLDQLESKIYRVIPVTTYSGYVVDESGLGLNDATVEVTAPAEYVRETQTVNDGVDDGYFEFVDLPKTGAVYQFRASKAGYVSASFTSADLAADNIIVLAAAEVDAYISGTVSGGPAKAANVYAYYEDVAGDMVLAGAATSYAATGAYRIDFAEDPGATEYILTASFSGYFGAITTASGTLPIANADIAMAATTNTIDAKYGGACQTITLAGQESSMVQMPPGCVDTSTGVTSVTVDITTVSNPGSANTSGSGALLYVISMEDQNQNPINTFTVPILITVPFDLSVVAPGDLESGNYVIRHADNLNDLISNGPTVKEVAPADIVSVDYVGDGKEGLATFRVTSLSTFGVGGAAAPAGGGGDGGGGGGGCFIATAAYGSGAALLLLLALLSASVVAALRRLPGRQG